MPLPSWLWVKATRLNRCWEYIAIEKRSRSKPVSFPPQSLPRLPNAKIRAFDSRGFIQENSEHYKLSIILSLLLTKFLAEFTLA
ncbi:hypothetical protein KSS87_021514 [Heliosperma pusillum]|nr:hypothetical protein KSS87_021514 [Heliosperma pusillum]